MGKYIDEEKERVYPHERGRQTDIKEVFIAIFIGACVAFISTLFDGVIQWLQGYGNNLTGAVASSASYIIKKTIA